MTFSQFGFDEGCKTQIFLQKNKQKKTGVPTLQSFLISGELSSFSTECNMAVGKFLGQVSEAS